MYKKLLLTIACIIITCGVAHAQHASNKSLKDNVTGADITIDYAHHEIHSGSHFKAGCSDLDLDTDQTLAYCLTTSGTTKLAHYQLTAHTTGPVTVELYENPTIVSYGTAGNILNRNRSSSKVSVMGFNVMPKYSSAGTKLVTRWIGGTGFKADLGGEFRADSELVLKPNEDYLVVVTGNGDNIKAAIGGDWYEHTSRVST